MENEEIIYVLEKVKNDYLMVDLKIRETFNSYKKKEKTLDDIKGQLLKANLSLSNLAEERNNILRDVLNTIKKLELEYSK